MCPLDGEEVDRKQAARGFEVAPDQYVLVEDDELHALEPKKSRMIEISDFVDLSQIDPIYYEQALLPRTPGGRRQGLLAPVAGDGEKKRVGIGKFVFHEHEYVVALRPLGEILCVEILRFADEIVSRQELEEIAGDEGSADKSSSPWPWS